MPLTGEQIQQLGEAGSQRAKRWLESTCRAEVKWNNPHLGVKKLQFQKAGADAASDAQADFFSFDLGGSLLGGDVDGEMFLAECKKYQSANDQGTHYRRFLAGCYRVERDFGNIYDHFLWITWAPFLVNSWDKIVKADYVKESIESAADCTYIALGDDEFADETADAVASKLLIVVLSDAQEYALALHGDELMHVRKALLEHRDAQ